MKSVTNYFNKAKRTVEYLIIRKFTKKVTEQMADIMNEEINTLHEILEDPAVEKLTEDVVTAILDNKEALINLQAHFKRFLVRVQKKVELHNTELESIAEIIGAIWEE